ncbi:MAG: hypothetical protein SynsKO_39310 [Synoicihabitans sp.]
MGGAGTAEEQIRQKVRRLQNPDGTHPSLELCSPPYSDMEPESHPWVQASDMIHVHWTAGLIDWTRFSTRVGRPTVVTLHDQEPYLGCIHYEGELTSNPSIEPIEQSCRKVRRAAWARLKPVVVGNSEWNTRKARNSEMFPSSTVYQTVYYPLDTEIFSAGNKSHAREVLGIPSEQIVIGFGADQIDNPRKGMDVLVSALAHLPLGVSAKCSLLSFGRKPTASLAQGLQISIRHLGEITSLQKQAHIYQAIDIMVVPSREEAFGQTAAESLACETPVVASNSGGLPETVRDGATGLLFESGDVSSLIHSLQTMIEDASLRKRLGKQGRNLVHHRHSPSTAAEAYQRIYQTHPNLQPHF